MTSGVELRPLDRGDVGWLTDLHNDAFSDHVVPAVLDASALAFYLDETDVVPELSRAAFVHEQPASFCLAALRGTRGSVRGEGTARRFRRQGLGGMVLDGTLEALRESVSSNSPALALYEGRGFRRRRRLVGWSLRRVAPRRGRRRDRLWEMDSDAAVARLSAWGWADASWQLEPESLEHLPAYALGDSAVAMGKQRGPRLWLYALAVDPAARRQGLGTRLVRALPGERVGVPALVPETWEVAAAFLAAVGGERERYDQWELELPLEVVSK
jgi:ribosomal protein S18 acetylase RimI-like enzyme